MPKKMDLEHKLMLAAFLDLFIFFFLLVGSGSYIDRQLKDHHLTQFSLPIFILLISSAGALPMHLTGSTLGQAILRLKLVNSAGETPGLLRSYIVCFQLTFILFANRGRTMSLPEGWHAIPR